MPYVVLLDENIASVPKTIIIGFTEIIKLMIKQGSVQWNL